jgi:pimeloyl-ACP methyl ester carboxylesterase
MDIVLIGGLWLDGSAWDDVTPVIAAAGHRPLPLTLPGQGDGNRSATLADQVAAVLALVDAAPGPVVVVGHSAASALAWIAADARPEKLARIMMIGGFPVADGEKYADILPISDGVMPFPGWAKFEGPDAADLDPATRARMAAAAVPVPEAVARGVVQLSDPRRYEVPLVLVCPEFTPAQAREWIAEGELPELTRAKNVEFVDIDSGHWPMVTRPAELGEILVAGL